MVHEMYRQCSYRRAIFSKTVDNPLSTRLRHSHNSNSKQLTGIRHAERKSPAEKYSIGHRQFPMGKNGSIRNGLAIFNRSPLVGHFYFSLLRKFNHWLTSCKSAEFASRYKIVRREPGRDEKILSDHRQDGNDEVHRL